ncbi:ABC transporter substrate-binding protein [Phreatobacter aquaticus]|nr:ABC transporter substrate-binding protein [Phreatobacter aquaticus]
MARSINRRTFTASALATLTAPSLSLAQGANVLKFVPQTDVAVLDPVWTTTYPTRDHGYLVFDTLFGMDGQYKMSPQMLEGAATEADGKVWNLTLRAGLKFHDGSAVLARDCVASIKRWGARDAFGQALMAATDELSAPDDKTIRFRLKYPFPLLPDALGKASPNMCAMMPERLANTSPTERITEMVGSGPYRFLAGERVPGALIAYAKFDGYVPRSSGTPDWTAGPKVAHFERIEWRIMPDSNTALSALRAGEIDWWYSPDADLLPAIRRMNGVASKVIDPTGWISTMRLNHLVAPFDNAALRRVVLSAVSQADFMQGQTSERDLWKDGVGIFCPGTPMASDAGMEVLTKPRDLAALKKAVIDAGYKGEKVVVLGATDIASSRALSDVGADLLQKLGFNVDYQLMDWGTVVQRRAKTEPVEQGGWNVFHTFWSGTDHFTPAGHAFLRANGRNGAPGWPTVPALETMRDDWFKAPSAAAAAEVARKMQLLAFQEVPYVPLGQRFFPTAYRSNLTGMLNGNPVFWNIKRG